MAANSVIVPFDHFVDRTGAPLEAGKIYVGIANSDPEVSGNQIQAYTNRALSVTASQPLRTLGGTPSFQGMPGKIFVDADDYSITVRDKNDALIYTSLTNLDDAPLASTMAVPWQFETVAKMILGQAVDGSTIDFANVPGPGWVETKWNQTAQKTGGARYEIIPIGSYSGTPDQICDHTVLGGLYVAQIIVDSALKVTSCGVIDNDNSIDYGVNIVAMLALLAKHGLGGTIDLEGIQIFKDTTIDIPRDVGVICDAGSAIQAKTSNTGTGFRFTATGSGYVSGDRPEAVFGSITGFDIGLVVSAANVSVKAGKISGYTLGVLFEYGASIANVQALQITSTNDTAVKIDATGGTVDNITVNADYVFAISTVIYLETGGGNIDSPRFQFGTVSATSATLLECESQSESGALYVNLKVNKYTGLRLISLTGTSGGLSSSEIEVNHWTGGNSGYAVFVATLMAMSSTKIKVNNQQNPAVGSWLQTGAAFQCEFDFLFLTRTFSRLVSTSAATTTSTNRYLLQDADFNDAPPGSSTDLQDVQIDWSVNGGLSCQHKHVRYVFTGPLTTDELTLYMTHQLAFSGEARFRVTNLESIVDGGTFQATINHAEVKVVDPSTYGLALEIVFKLDKNVSFIIGDEIIFLLEVVQ